MYAISFNMLIADLKQNYGETYNNAFYEIAVILDEFHFFSAQGSVYQSVRRHFRATET